MTGQRSRSARKHGKRRKQRKQLSGLLLILVLLLMIGGTFVWAQKQGLLASFPTSKKASTKKEITTTPTSSTSSTSQETPASSSQPEDGIIWEKQEAPVQIPILMYHAIHDMQPGEEENASLIVAPSVFESHLQALQEAGYYSLSPEEAYKVLAENVLPQGKKVVWLTFDDSMIDFYIHAYPLLKQYNIKATNNVITGFTEEGRPGNLSVEQMLEMKQFGMSFQGHTITHPDLEMSDPETQRHELQVSKDFLNTHLQQETIAVAYPVGRYSADTLAIAEQVGYKLGVTTNGGLAGVEDGLLSLDRVRILPETTAEGLLWSMEQ